MAIQHSLAMFPLIFVQNIIKNLYNGENIYIYIYILLCRGFKLDFESSMFCLSPPFGLNVKYHVSAQVVDLIWPIDLSFALQEQKFEETFPECITL